MYVYLPDLKISNNNNNNKNNDNTATAIELNMKTYYNKQQLI